MHGFGASAYSWEAVMPSLAQRLRVPVIAFDRPAFGLSARPNVAKGRRQAKRAGAPLPRYSPYSTEFSAEVVARLVKELGKKQAVVVGHSAGASPALASSIMHRELVSAVILVAPAVRPPPPKSASGQPFAGSPPAPQPGSQVNGVAVAAADRAGDGSGSTSSLAEDPPGDAASTPGGASLALHPKPTGGASRFPPLAWVSSCVSSIWWLAHKLAHMAAALARWLKRSLTSAWQASVSAFLRSAIMCWLIRFSINRVGVQGVKMAFYDPKRCTDDVLRGYTKPLMCMGWDNALLEFTIESKYPPKSGEPGAVSGANRVSSQLAQVDVPVLIIGGAQDKIVPISLAHKLEKEFKDVHLDVLQECGHLPHEELPSQFVESVVSFLGSLGPGRKKPVAS